MTTQLVKSEENSVTGVTLDLAHLKMTQRGWLRPHISYTIVRRVTRDETWATVYGMMVGGGLGDISGIYITRHWG